MNKPPFAKQAVNYFYERFAKNYGSFLLWAGILGWATSCFNQTTAIIMNKKIPKEQKYFLIPQEITDGVVNTLLFAFFTRSFTRVGERLVESGKLITPEIRQHLGKYASEIGKKGFNLLKKPEMDQLDAKFNPKLSEKYYDFANGISFAFSTLGSIVSCNFVTPFVRNKIASHRQKAALERDKAKQDIKLNDVTTNVVLAQNRLSIDDYRRKASVSPISPSSSLKI